MNTVKISANDVERIASNLPMKEIVNFLEDILRASHDGKIKVTDKKVVPPESNEPYHFHLELETEDEREVKVRKVIDESRPDGVNVKKNTLITLINSDRIYEIFGDFITDTRTGASGALAAKYLTENPSVIAIVGAGKVPRQFALIADYLFNPREIRFATRSEKSRIEFYEFLKNNTDAEIQAYDIFNFDHRKRLLKDADILFEAAPLYKDGEDVKFKLKEIMLMRSGAHISSMTGDGNQHNFHEDVLLKSVIVVDDENSARKNSELRHLAENEGNVIGTLFDAAAGKLEIYKHQLTFYDSSGNAPMDRLVELVVKEYNKD
ncbi:hypothetical protein HYV89_01700 [Candidatus Woesearchaeota archaeon]|nr:hypothetical protein [Candidatus Woesearchaeota archaeon]